MQNVQNLKFDRMVGIRKSAAFWVGCVALAAASWAAEGAWPQGPVKQDQAARAPETTQAQPVEKQQPMETKAQLQQKQLADDTAKLLELANELKADMDKTTKDTLSLAVVKKAEQVEKLAHKVREEMKASIGN